MKISTRGWLAIVCAVLVVLALAFAGVYIAGFKKGTTKAAGVDPELLKLAQANLKTTEAQLKAAGNMIATLRADSSGKEAKLRVRAATIADLQLKLASHKGGGATPATNSPWKVYEDKYLYATFRVGPDTLFYTLYERPVKISLVEGVDNKWACYAWGVLDSAAIRVDSFNVQRNETWAPPRPWYKKLATAAKFIGVAAAAGTVGYLAGKNNN